MDEIVNLNRLHLSVFNNVHHEIQLRHQDNDISYLQTFALVSMESIQTTN